MTVELRYCELCGVIVPVDRDRPEPERYICDNCRTVADPAPGRGETTPSPGLPVTERPDLAATQPVSRPPRPSESLDLAATQPVSRPPRPQRPPEPGEPPKVSPQPQERFRLGATLVALAVLLPMILGGAVLICTTRQRGFAVRGATGERLEWFGDKASRGARRLQQILLGVPTGEEPIAPPVREGPFASTDGDDPEEILDPVETRDESAPGDDADPGPGEGEPPPR